MPVPKDDRREKLSAAALVALTALLAHLPVLANGFTNWDDDHYLTLNPLVLQLTPEHLWRLFSSFQLSNYHPLALLAHSLWHQLFGLSSVAHHALSLALHGANAVLVFLLGGALGLSSGGALAAGLLFAVHPLQVEAVAWVAQLKTVLATALFLAGLLAYARDGGEPRRHFPLAAFVLTACSLLAKPAAVLAPLILLLIDRLRGRAFTWPVLREKMPFAALALASTVLTLLAQREALRDTVVQPLAYTPFVAAHGVLFLLAKALVPFGLSALYPFPGPADGGLPWTFLLALPAFGLLAAALWRPLRSPSFLSFGALFFLITVSPTLQVVPVGLAHMADRYFYLPSVGLFLLAGRGVDRLLGGLPAGDRRRRWLALSALALVLALGTLSWRRATIWKDGVSLWQDVTRRYPGSFFAWGNLAHALAVQGRSSEALAVTDRALELVGGRRYSGRILFTRGIALQETGRLEEAVGEYTRGLEYYPAEVPVLVNRGNALDALGRPREALADYARAIAVDADHALAWYNQGITLAALGDSSAAVASFDRALRLDPGYAPAYRNRAKALQALGREADAAHDLRHASELEAQARR